MASETTEYWNAKFEGAGFPYGAVNSISQVFEDPHVQSRGMEAEVEHEGLGTVKQVSKTMYSESIFMDYAWRSGAYSRCYENCSYDFTNGESTQSRHS